MRNDKPAATDRCQEQKLVLAAEELSPSDRARNLLLQLLSAARRRIFRDKTMPRPGSGKDPHFFAHEEKPESRESSGGRKDQRESFRNGDPVEIRSWPEIKATLDENWCTGGLAFMEGMQQYCGRRTRVFKRIRTIYDEKREKMIKVRNAYLLEGIICDGRGAFDKEGCDKSCLYFWKDRWLRKVEQ
jgi:hypothetical protein